MNSFSSLAFDDSGLDDDAPFTAHKAANGRKTNTSRIIEEREGEEDGEFESFLIINGVATEEGFAEHGWRRQPPDSCSPRSYSSKHAPQCSCVENEPRALWVTSSKDPPVSPAGFKEGGKRKKKKHREAHKKKSTKRHR